jgi:hypothetical protein
MAFGSFLVRKQKLNKFNLSHERGFTCNMGELVPVLCEEVLPGDIWKLSSMSLIRLQPMVAPIMHNVNVFTHYFFVPARLLQDNWEPFITGGENGDDATPVPVVKSPAGTGWTAGSLADYLGYVTDVPEYTCTAYQFRAYAKVFNDWYRNQNFTEELSLSTGDGLDTTTNTTLQNRCWQADYFTDNLPFAQRGEPVSLPLDISAPVIGNGKTLGLKAGGANTTGYGLGTGREVSSTQLSAYTGIYRANAGSSVSGDTPANGVSLGVTSIASDSGLVADLTQASAITVNALRDAIQLQVAAEIAARSGGRYVEYLLGNFGVRSADYRLQRPEYLGGGKSPIIVSQVLQTSATDDATTPQANMAGHGISVNTSHAFKKRFTEHGYILGIMSIMPDTKYFQGSRRQFNRKSRLDFPLPVFSHLGEQATLEEEIFTQSDNVSTKVGDVTVKNDTIFGFLPRYEEMRHIPSTVHGDFKNSLKFWHLAREFEQPPLLNEDFIVATPSKRIFAVTSQKYDSCLVNIGFNISAYRPLPVQGIPGWMDHLF